MGWDVLAGRMKAHCISSWMYPLSLKVDLQFIMEDFSVAQIPGPVHQGSKNDMFAGRMVVWSGVQVKVYGGKLQQTSSSRLPPVSHRCQCQEKYGGRLSPSPQCELNIPVKYIQVVQEPLQLLWSVSPDDKQAIHIMETTDGVIFVIYSRVLPLKSSIKKLVVRGVSGDPVGHPISVLIELSTKVEVFRGDRMFKQGQDVFFKVLIVEV